MTIAAKGLHYLRSMPPGKVTLWCYFLWYLSTVAFHFDPAPRLWLNALGIAVLIGFALMLSIGDVKATSEGRWQTFRLFFMPFCVSSFSSLTKGQGFMLIISPSLIEVEVSAGLCVGFVGLVLVLKTLKRAESK